VNKYREVFGSKKVLLPVIYAQNYGQVIENIKIANGEGADGVFLVNHGKVTAGEMIGFLVEARKLFPYLWIGVNFLDLSTSDVFRCMPPFVKGLWVSDALVYDVFSHGCAAPEVYNIMVQGGVGCDAVYFGGVPFMQKVQTEVAMMADYARKFVDVIVMSSDTTGRQSSAEKVQVVHSAIDGHPIAFAGEMTVESVKPYTDFVDCFLVTAGLGVEGELFNLNYKKVFAFANLLSGTLHDAS